jgi:hypothetical protein
VELARGPEAQDIATMKEGERADGKAAGNERLFNLPEDRELADRSAPPDAIPNAAGVRVGERPLQLACTVLKLPWLRPARGLGSPAALLPGSNFDLESDS